MRTEIICHVENCGYNESGVCGNDQIEIFGKVCDSFQTKEELDKEWERTEAILKKMRVKK